MSRNRDLLRPWSAARLAVLTGVVITAVVAAFVTNGRAASTNTCSTPTTCFTVTVDPPLLSPGAQGLVTAKFRSQGSATATHTMITLTAPSGIDAGAKVSAQLNGSPIPGCPATIGAGQTITCSFGSIPGFAVLRVFVMFTNAVAAGSSLDAWPGTLSFAEGGEGNNTNGNDTFTASSAATPITDGSTQQGLCAGTSDDGNLGPTGSNGQKTLITHVSLDSTGLPCTPVAAGVRPGVGVELTKGCGGHACTPGSQVSFAAFPPQPANNLGQVTVLIPASLYTGSTKNVPLYELPLDGSTTAPGVALNSCTSSTPFAAGTDSCIASQTKTKIGSTQYVAWDLRVEGSPVDGRYTG